MGLPDQLSDQVHLGHHPVEQLFIHCCRTDIQLLDASRQSYPPQDFSACITPDSIQRAESMLAGCHGCGNFTARVSEATFKYYRRATTIIKISINPDISATDSCCLIGCERSPATRCDFEQVVDSRLQRSVRRWT